MNNYESIYRFSSKMKLHIESSDNKSLFFVILLIKICCVLTADKNMFYFINF